MKKTLAVALLVLLLACIMSCAAVQMGQTKVEKGEVPYFEVKIWSWEW